MNVNQINCEKNYIDVLIVNVCWGQGYSLVGRMFFVGCGVLGLIFSLKIFYVVYFKYL